MSIESRFAHQNLASLLDAVFGTRRDNSALSSIVAAKQVFVPLARLLGLYSLKQELEELSFHHSNPEAYKLVMATLLRIRAEQQPTVMKVQVMVPSCCRLSSAFCIVSVQFALVRRCLTV